MKIRALALSLRQYERKNLCDQAGLGRKTEQIQIGFDGMSSENANDL